MTEQEYIDEMRLRDESHYAELRKINAEHVAAMAALLDGALEHPKPDMRIHAAMAAMQGLAAQKDERYWTASTGKTVEEWQADALRADAAYAVRMADALLAELAKDSA